MDASGTAVTHTTSDVPSGLRHALEGLDAVIVSGIPGMTAEGLGLDGPFFPSTTVDLMKVLREQGVNVDFEAPDDSHPLVSHKAAEFWIPVAVFIETGTATAAGNLLSQAIIGLLGRRRAETSVLHVKTGVAKRGGEKIEWFEAHGKGADVLKALKVFRG